MDWAALGLTDRILAWLEAAGREQYANEARLDPYATSMRDFDDVSDDLRRLQKGLRPDRTRSGQRITDLRKAGLGDAAAIALSPLGAAVLKAWTRYGVAGRDKDDELARLLVTLLEARRSNDARYASFEQYWSDLRTYFDPLALIENWDRLYAINYMDYERAGFAPGAILRQEGVAVSDIEFDLPAFAAANGNAAASAGGARLAGAIASQIARGRHRASFAMALEIAASGGGAAPAIVARFGIPLRLHRWKPFTPAQQATMARILADYAQPATGPGTTGASGRAQVPPPPPSQLPAPLPPPPPAPALPAAIDFSKALKQPPRPRHSADRSKAGKAGRRKVDHQKKAKADEEVGRLGEEFALRYEQWRLRNHPKLLARIEHVSLYDDTLGYDIASFEENGSPRYVEVKATLGPLETRFFLSANELAAATVHGNAYVILRTARLGSDPQCCEIRPPFQELDMTTAVFSVTFRADLAVQP